MRLSLGFAFLLSILTIGIVATEPNKCPVTLLKGYKHKGQFGIDSRPGTIYKDGGLIITYDICGQAGCAILPGNSRTDERFTAYTEQSINGIIIRIAFKKANPSECVMTLPKYYANFVAQIKTPQEMADMLLMVLSFDSAFCK